jgi:hypothetical protein
VIEVLMRRQAARPDAVVCLKGNHEQLAIMAHDDPRAMPIWLQNNAAATQRSYWRSGGRIMEPHLSWLRARPLCHDDRLRFYVHAGIDLTVPLDAQTPDTMLWVREPFLTDCDKIDCGRFIVHGHTPQMSGKPELCRRRVNLDTRPEPLAFLTDRQEGPAARDGVAGKERDVTCQFHIATPIIWRFCGRIDEAQISVGYLLFTRPRRREA